MISLDWKERLKKDSIDFYERKLPAEDYDIDIIYNAYPQRIDNKIPQAVLTLVAKTIAGKISKNADQYLDFYDYIYRRKGENGKIIFAYLIAAACKHKPDEIMQYLQSKLFKINDQKEANLLMDKAVLPLLKRDSEKYLPRVLAWLKKDNPTLIIALEHLLLKYIKHDKSKIKPIFSKIEMAWFAPSHELEMLSYHFLKQAYKLDKDFYFQVYHSYQNTRNPDFAGILCEAIICQNEVVEQMVENWSKSGNIKLKKIGLHGQKLLKRYQKKKR
ncbi:MAG: hypothetical protein R6U84_01460 [Candidatus Cloacimonadales bacterium]